MSCDINGMSLHSSQSKSKTKNILEKPLIIGSLSLLSIYLKIIKKLSVKKELIKNKLQNQKGM
jgi:hypothetical protein